MTIDVIAFDLGGVLFAEGTSAFISTFPAADQERVAGILKSPFSKDLRRGKVDEDEFWRSVQGDLPSGWAPQAFRDAWYDAYTVDEGLFELVKRLHGADQRIVVFSGNIRTRVEHLDRKYAFRRYFADEIYSYEEGFTKPDPGFVEVLLDRCGVAPERIAYIDDKQSALAPALARGVKGILYRNGQADTLTSELATLGVPL